MTSRWPLLAIAFLLGLPCSAGAVPITTLAYTEGATSFTWIFTWNRQGPVGLDPLTYFPPGASIWISSVFFSDGASPIIFRSQHQVPGGAATFTFSLDTTTLVPSIPPDSFDTITTMSVPHPPDAQDKYEIVYNIGIQPNGMAQFELFGEHVVAEPDTRSLLALAAALVLGYSVIKPRGRALRTGPSNRGRHRRTSRNAAAA